MKRTIFFFLLNLIFLQAAEIGVGELPPERREILRSGEVRKVPFRNFPDSSLGPSALKDRTQAELPVQETLAQITEAIEEKKRGAYFCFSETDIRLILNGTKDLWEQLEMEKMLSLEGESIFKSFSLPFTALHGHRREDQWALPLFRKIARSWRDSYASLPSSFLSTLYREELIHFLAFLRSKDLMVLSDIDIPQTTQQLLFGSNCRCSSLADSFALPIDRYTVIVLLAAPSEKPIALEWLNQEIPIFCLDLSGIKMEMSEWPPSVWERWLDPVPKDRDCPEPPIQKGRLKILYTSALISHRFEERKQEYIKSLEAIRQYGYLDHTYIAESGPYTSASFFDEYCNHVFYANTNDLSLVNKGINEVKACLAAFQYFQFSDEDIIVKLTGRYLLHQDRLFRLLEHRSDIDAVASPHPQFGVSTGCFAMRGKYFRYMLEEMDFENMERNLIDIERLVAGFLKKIESDGAKVIYLDKMGISANVAHGGIQQW